jgi:5-methylthioadenosine/S-adenosylhomocysteine deaminase
MLGYLRLPVATAMALGALACGSSAPPGGPTSSSAASTGSGGHGGTGGQGGGTTTSTGGAGVTSTASGSGGGGMSASSTSSGTGGHGGVGTGGLGTGGLGTGGLGTGGIATSSTGTGGLGASDAGITCGVGPAAEILQVGSGAALVLRGTVVTPTLVFAGEVLVTGDTISCVAASCANSPGAVTATVVDTHGIIFPGLIDTHNHILFDSFDETDWTPLQVYTNHNQWTNEARYGAMVDAKQYLNGEGSSPVDYGCEMDKYGEIKGLIAGTTAIVGAANPANRACYGTLSRTIDQSPNGLGADKVQVATLFPATSAADGVCTNFGTGKTDAYVIHVAEGVDATALKEFTTLGTVTTTDDCLYAPKTAIVHGAALGDPELSIMAQDGMSLVWSPQSNVFLYGGGTDLTKTANVPLALSKGINVALAPDWSIGGSQNLLDELRFADRVDNTVWGNQITPQALVEMVTVNAARVLGLESVLGSLAPGMKGDIMVIGGDGCAPYDALLASTPADVRLVLVGGVPLYGDAQLRTLGPATPGCEDLDVCTSAKFVCVATSSSTTTDKFGQTLVDIENTLGDATEAYDALALSAWTFAPITPLVKCP